MEHDGPLGDGDTLGERTSFPRRLRRLTLTACAAIVLASSPLHAAKNQFAFTVEITLSPKAAATLTKLSEGIVVSASYAGEPLPTAVQHADQIGQINLGMDTVEAPGKAETVHIAGSRTKRDRISWITGPVLLNVNVYSARHSGPDNILACDFFDGTLQQAARQPVLLHCSLITENVPTQHKF